MEASERLHDQRIARAWRWQKGPGTSRASQHENKIWRGGRLGQDRRLETQTQGMFQRHPFPEVPKVGREGRRDTTSKTPGVVVKLQMMSSPVTRLQAKSQRWRKMTKGTSDRGMRWHLGAGLADKNGATPDRLQFITAQPHKGNWPWRKWSKSLSALISSSLQWTDQAFSTGLLWGLNEIRYK